MKNNKKLLWLILALAIVGIWFLGNKLNTKPGSQNNTPTNITYTNQTYGFKFALPLDWLGYKVIDDPWQGLSNDAVKGETLATSGPQLLIRHPLWTESNPRQDIPIMIFTINQWSDLQADKFHIGAAPIGPSELGRNKNYVFALPARYNFAFLQGYEQVEQILSKSPLLTF